MTPLSAPSRSDLVGQALPPGASACPVKNAASARSARTTGQVMQPMSIFFWRKSGYASKARLRRVFVWQARRPTPHPASAVKVR